METTGIDTIEFNLKSSSSDKNLQQNMQYFFQPFLFCTGEEGAPIACVTFVLSFFIAMDPILKTYFLITFQGYLPNITIFLLEGLHTNALNDDYYVESIGLSKGYSDACYKMGLGESLYYYFSIKEFDVASLTVFTWFKYLSDTYKKGEQNYFQYSKYSFKSYKEKPNILSALTYENEKVFYIKNSVFEKLSLPKKKIYHLLTMALEPQLKNTARYTPERVLPEKIEFKNTYSNFNETFLNFIIDPTLNLKKKYYNKKINK